MKTLDPAVTDPAVLGPALVQPPAAETAAYVVSTSVKAVRNARQCPELAERYGR